MRKTVDEIFGEVTDLNTDINDLKAIISKEHGKRSEDWTDILENARKDTRTSMKVLVREYDKILTERINFGESECEVIG
jgi:hypothetical protein